jgi:hypothetical protein
MIGAIARSKERILSRLDTRGDGTLASNCFVVESHAVYADRPARCTAGVSDTSTAQDPVVAARPTGTSSKNVPTEFVSTLTASGRERWMTLGEGRVRLERARDAIVNEATSDTGKQLARSTSIEKGDTARLVHAAAAAAASSGKHEGACTLAATHLDVGLDGLFDLVFLGFLNPHQ